MWFIRLLRTSADFWAFSICPKITQSTPVKALIRAAPLRYCTLCGVALGCVWSDGRLMNDESDELLRVEIDALALMDIASLKAKWSEVFGRPCNLKHPKSDLLRRNIAHALQEQSYGGLSMAARRSLEERRTYAYLSEKRGAGRPPCVEQTDQKTKTAPLTPGTVLRKTWRGDVYEVEVLPVGFLYARETYGSLSKIARVITGVRWSGPAFFGLRGKAKKTPT